MTGTLYVLARVVLVATTVVSVALPIIWHIVGHGRWLNDPLGRMLMIGYTTVALLLIFSLLRPLFLATELGTEILLTLAIVLYGILGGYKVFLIRYIIRRQLLENQSGDTHEPEA